MIVAGMGIYLRFPAGTAAPEMTPLLSIFGIVVGVLTFYEFCREMMFVVLP